jgi:hypothetical protein
MLRSEAENALDAVGVTKIKELMRKSRLKAKAPLRSIAEKMSI